MKYKIKKEEFDALPDGLKALYSVGQDGIYTLQVEGVVEKSRLDEFRDNNTTLLKQLEQFKDIDPAKAREAAETQRRLEEKKLLDAGEVDKVVEQRISAMKKDYDTQVSDLGRKLESSNRQLDVLIIDNSVRDNAIKLGVAPSAVDDVLLRARTVYRVEEGKAIPKDSQGNTIFGKDGVNPMGINDWIGGLKETAPHLFQPSQGSGASGGGNTNVKQAATTSATGKIAQGLQAGSTIIQ